MAEFVQAFNGLSWSGAIGLLAVCGAIAYVAGTWIKSVFG